MPQEACLGLGGGGRGGRERGGSGRRRAAPSMRNIRRKRSGTASPIARARSFCSRCTSKRPAKRASSCQLAEERSCTSVTPATCAVHRHAGRPSRRSHCPWTINPPPAPPPAGLHPPTPRGRAATGCHLRVLVERELVEHKVAAQHDVAHAELVEHRLRLRCRRERRAASGRRQRQRGCGTWVGVPPAGGRSAALRCRRPLASAGCSGSRSRAAAAIGAPAAWSPAATACAAVAARAGRHRGRRAASSAPAPICSRPRPWRWLRAA